MSSYPRRKPIQKDLASEFLIEDAAERHGVPVNEVKGIAEQETGYLGFKPTAKSPAGARGPLQVMPGTGRRHVSEADFNTVPGQVEAGVLEYKRLRDKYGDARKAFRGYHGGEGAINNPNSYDPYAHISTNDYEESVANYAGLGKQKDLAAEFLEEEGEVAPAPKVEAAQIPSPSLAQPAKGVGEKNALDEPVYKLSTDDHLLRAPGSKPSIRDLQLPRGRSDLTPHDIPAPRAVGKLHQFPLQDLVDPVVDDKGIRYELKKGVSPEQFLEELSIRGSAQAGFTPEALERFRKETGQRFPVGRFYQGADNTSPTLAVQDLLKRIQQDSNTGSPTFQYNLPEATRKGFEPYIASQQQEQAANQTKDIEEEKQRAARERTTFLDKAGAAAINLSPGGPALAGRVLEPFAPEVARNLKQFDQEALARASLGYVDPTNVGEGRGEKYDTVGGKVGGAVGAAAPIVAASAIGGPGAGIAAGGLQPFLERRKGESRYDFESRAKDAALNTLLTVAGGNVAASELPALKKFITEQIVFTGGTALLKPLTHGEYATGEELLTNALVGGGFAALHGGGGGGGGRPQTVFGGESPTAAAARANTRTFRGDPLPGPRFLAPEAGPAADTQISQALVPTRAATKGMSSEEVAAAQQRLAGVPDATAPPSPPPPAPPSRPPTTQADAEAAREAFRGRRKVQEPVAPSQEVPSERAAEIVAETPVRTTGVEGIVARERQGRRRVEDEAAVDKATGLQSKNQWEGAKERIDADPNREVVLLDVNDLKKFNDNVGHKVGDEYLAHAGKVVMEEAEKLGISPRQTYRIGGDEIVIDAPKGKGEELATAVKARVAEFERNGIRGSVAAGVGERAEIADQNMYVDKAAMKGKKATSPLFHGSPTQRDVLKAGSMLTDDPVWAAGYTTKVNPDLTEDFTGRVHEVAHESKNPYIVPGEAASAEGVLIELAQETGKTANSLQEAARIVHEEFGYDAIISKREGKVTGAIPLVDVPVSKAHAPVDILESATGDVPSNLKAALERHRQSSPVKAAVEEAANAGQPVSHHSEVQARAEDGTFAVGVKEEVKGKEPWEMTRRDFLQERELDRDFRAQYVDEQGNVIKSSREHPSTTKIPPVGTWRISDDGKYNKYGDTIEQLQEIPIEKVTGAEDPKLEGRQSDVDRYADWAKEGRQPPPLRAAAKQDGTYSIMDGHRRLAAAKAAGKETILAWVAPSADTGLRGHGDSVIDTDLTHQLAVKKAIAEGKTVPPEVLADYPDLAGQPQQAPPVTKPPAPAPTIVKNATPRNQSIKESDSLISAVVKKGGLKLQGERGREIQSRLDKQQRPGLLRRDGKPIEDVIADLEASGYPPFTRDSKGNIGVEALNELVERIEGETSGKKTYQTEKMEADAAKQLDAEWDAWGKGEHLDEQAKEEYDRAVEARSHDEIDELLSALAEGKGNEATESRIEEISLYQLGFTPELTRAIIEEAKSYNKPDTSKSIEEGSPRTPASPQESATGKPAQDVEDIARVQELHKSLKEQGISVDEYLKQQALPGNELSEGQQALLREIDKKTPKSPVKEKQQELLDTSPTLESRQAEVAPEKRVSGGLFEGKAISDFDKIARFSNNAKTTALEQSLHSAHEGDRVKHISSDVEGEVGGSVTSGGYPARIIKLSDGGEIKITNSQASQWEILEVGEKGRKAAEDRKIELQKDDLITAAYEKFGYTNQREFPRKELVKKTIEELEQIASKGFRANQYGTKNTITLTKEQAQKELDAYNENQKNKRGSGGLDTEDLIHLAKIAAYHIEAGAREFGDFSKRMVEYLGEHAEEVKPYLRQLFDEYHGKVKGATAPTTTEKKTEKTAERSLPKTLESAGLESGNAKTYTPQTIAGGVEEARRIVKEKGVEGAMEWVKNPNNNGVEWASVGYEALNQSRAKEAELRKSNPKGADEIAQRRLEFLDDFAEGATSRGQAIVGIKAIEEFAPDRAAYIAAKRSKAGRGRGLSPEEESRITKIGEQSMLANDRLKTADKQLEAKKGRITPVPATKENFRTALESQGKAAMESLKARAGNFNFGTLTRKAERGAIGERQALEGDAELLAQYAAGRLDKVKTLADLKTEMVKEFGKEVEPYLTDITHRAYQIRQEARVTAMAESSPAERRTILGEIQKEINALKADRQKAARLKELSLTPAEIRTRLSSLRREYMEASEAGNKAYRAEQREGRKAARQATVWDAPLRNESKEARARLKDAKDPQSAIDDLVSVGVEKLLPETGSIPRMRSIFPSKFYSEMKAEFPNLVTKKNQSEIYKKAFQRVQDAKEAAREVARLRSGDKESRRLWDELGIDEEAQAILIRRAEALRQQQEARTAMVREFEHVSKGKVRRAVGEALSLPRALQSSIDAPLGRQGLFYLVTHPIQTMKYAVPGTIRGYTSLRRGTFEQHVKDLQSHPDYELAKKAELSGSIFEGGSEEQFRSGWADKIPHARLSEQAFNLGMDAQRLAVFSKYADIGRAEGYTFESNPEFFKQAAELVNAATGRAKMPEFMEKAKPLLNTIFYSPRLQVSRIKLMNDLLNPKKYLSYDPAMRKIAIQEVVRAVVGFGLVYGTAKAIAANNPNVTVPGDPDDSDFGKVKVGNTRYDLSGGEAGLIRTFYRLARAAGKGAAGEKADYGKDAGTILAQYFRSKLAPVPGAALNVATGKNIVGEPANLKVKLGSKQDRINTIQQNELIRLLAPMISGDLTDAVIDDGWMGVAKTAPALTGIGTNTFKKKEKKATASSRF